MNKNDKMLDSFFGIEIEMTGITRTQAAEVASEVLNGTLSHKNDGYDTYQVKAEDGRVWKFMRDASIETKKPENVCDIGSNYSVELVSPKLKYREDIETLQEIIRKLRKAGAVTNSSCGIHIHLDGKPHNARSIRNFVNIISSKEDLLYNALAIKGNRQRFCKKMSSDLVEKLNHIAPATESQIEDIWYENYDFYSSRSKHYHDSRYHFLNLHSYFQGHHTVELRGFNSTLHAGKVRSYIVLALALNNQALTQKSASAIKSQSENEKFAMRTYLNRIGLTGEEFKNCREHLTANLKGSSAFRYQVA
jgi:hypothetical protein